MSAICDLIPGAVKRCFDLAGIGVIAGVFIKALPVIAALLSAIWYGLQIYDWFKKRRQKMIPPTEREDGHEFKYPEPDEGDESETGPGQN